MGALHSSRAGPSRPYQLPPPPVGRRARRPWDMHLTTADNLPRVVLSLVRGETHGRIRAVHDRVAEEQVFGQDRLRRGGVRRPVSARTELQGPGWTRVVVHSFRMDSLPGLRAEWHLRHAQFALSARHGRIVLKRATLLHLIGFYLHNIYPASGFA